MADELVTIAEAVRTELNTSGRWSQPFTAERLYIPETELDSLDPGEMRVTVLMGGRSRGAASRGRSQVDYQIGILIQQKLLPNTDDAIALSVEDQCDPLIELVQEVADWFDLAGSSPLTTYTAANYFGSVNDPAYDSKSMDDGLFASLLVLTFRVWRDKR